MKLKDHGRAAADFAEAYTFTGGEDLAVNAALIEAWTQSAHLKEAVSRGLECIAADHTNQAVVEALRTAYRKLHGSFNGYDKAVQEAKRKFKDQLLATGVHAPAPQFTLKNLEGVPVKLSDLRGRVVVLQVISTWSSASGVSLVQLQKTFEQYQYYRNVAFLVVDSYEAPGVGGAHAKQFLAEARSTIPVVLDEDGAVADTFGVEGIPMRYIIDPQGNIRFKAAGFHDGPTSVRKLAEQIEALLNP